MCKAEVIIFLVLYELNKFQFVWFVLFVKVKITSALPWKLESAILTYFERTGTNSVNICVPLYPGGFILNLSDGKGYLEACRVKY